ncbi:3-phosphoserine/phosphohydroxythreonine transaminase [Rhodocaloribacter litoris]|uniref:3-phosphoserine/phosphohydroxythreonine transaminase n=1 Tax=Rhodocaloribacter litoris TaxID=2558931 RepID=UPI001E45AF48|nr:3-phosphoserine/phosphohydroxythreonine transaminase [Rhodocaloribacter litoris]QXD14817.1 3-phosphoserine/phosphohydroxythreonine transaminase [Rhodocaloribacter litoris]
MQTLEARILPGMQTPGRLYNFAAGPAVLPEPVLLEMKAELPLYKNVGASILEISHRSPEYTDVAERARAHLRRLLGLSDDWHILFLQGGASLQFHQVPLNFLPKDGTADYLVTGSWAKKALKEAQFLGNARVAASSEDRNFSYLPDPAVWDLDPAAAYLHFTSNNTIFGTQFATEPQVEVPLVCDASSDFLSRPIDIDRYGLIYAGAQKNVGPAGVTLVLVRDDFLQRRNRPLPTLLDYGTHTAKLFHTPPVYAVYVVEKVLRWLLDLGGLAAIAKINEAKAQQLYTRIDASDFYRGTAAPEARSKMNVTFRLPSEELEKRFVEEAKEAGLLALKGHRSVGGIRASIYNACPPEAVEALVDFMDHFERRHG